MAKRFVVRYQDCYSIDLGDGTIYREEEGEFVSNDRRFLTIRTKEGYLSINVDRIFTILEVQELPKGQ